MTLKELAAACGLSSSAVSKALNGYSDVGPETRAFVQAKAAELGFKPNAVARALKSGRTYDIGILFDELSSSGLTHSFFGPVIDSFRRTAEAMGYAITFITHKAQSDGMTYLEHCRSRGFDGVCIINCTYDNSEVRELVHSGVPLVSIDYVYEDKVCLSSDNDTGITKLTRCILSHGHRQIAFVTGEKTVVTYARLNGFLQEMKNHGIDVRDDYIINSKFHNPQAAKTAVTQLLNLPEPPTCIILPDDLSALGGMEAIRERGLKIPDDISITGYDGVKLLQMCTPRLTTYSQNTEQIGSEAARQLIGIIEKPQEERHGVIKVSGHLIEGETVAAPAPRRA